MKSVIGKVFIIGAGPGDPGLITVKALEKLKQADVVVYDRLINNDLLAYCKRECEKIFVGKESGYHPIEQESIIDILICKSKLGFSVVRLKGGNPFVFGRGSEEAGALKAAGIDYEIIPGITSGLSAPIYSGIPITHRGLITQCVLITAHECPDKPETQVEWEKLAKLKNTTLIIYMGASRIERICSELIKHGMSPTMPTAVIENGTLSKQRTITSSLDTIWEEYKKQNLHPPVIIMVGPTVSLRDEISWFEQKPLFNKRIVLVGNLENSSELKNSLYDLGGDLLFFPIKTHEEEIWETISSSKFQINENNFLDIKNETIYNTLTKKNNRYDLTFEISQEPNYDGFDCSSLLKYEQEEEIINNIKKNNADVYIFTSFEAVKNFFTIFGTETATILLRKSISLALNQSVQNALIKKASINVNVLPNKTAKEISKLICNFFNLSKG